MPFIAATDDEVCKENPCCRQLTHWWVQELRKSREIFERIRRRDLYNCVDYKVFKWRFMVLLEENVNPEGIVAAEVSTLTTSLLERGGVVRDEHAGARPSHGGHAKRGAVPVRWSAAIMAVYVSVGQGSDPAAASRAGASAPHQRSVRSGNVEVVRDLSAASATTQKSGTLCAKANLTSSIQNSARWQRVCERSARKQGESIQTNIWSIQIVSFEMTSYFRTFSSICFTAKEKQVAFPFLLFSGVVHV